MGIISGAFLLLAQAYFIVSFLMAIFYLINEIKSFLSYQYDWKRKSVERYIPKDHIYIVCGIAVVIFVAGPVMSIKGLFSR